MEKVKVVVGAHLVAPPRWTIPEIVVLVTNIQVVTVDSFGHLRLYDHMNGVLKDMSDEYWHVQNWKEE